MSDWLRKACGFKNAPAGTVIELDLGPDDLLLIETEQSLSDAVCKRIKEAFNGVLEKPGRTTLVLSNGLHAKVIHRTFAAAILNKRAK